MRAKYFCTISIALLLIFIIGCTANLKAEKKRAADRRNVGEAHMMQGDFTSALREFLEAEKIYADDPFLHNDLGFAYMAKGKLDKAIFHFKKTLALKSKYSDARNNLGIAYSRQGKWKQAIACFTTVSEDLLYATPYLPLTNLGWIYESRKMYDLAATHYQKALKLSPRYATALRGLGRTYLSLGKTTDAIGLLKEAVKNTKSAAETAESYFDLARAYETANNRLKAIAAYREVTTLAPNSLLAKQSLSRLTRLQKKP
jgi:type IV pilus assembly protein PilF